MKAIARRKTDRDGYEDHYKGKISMMFGLQDVSEYMRIYEINHLSPFCMGGTTKGFVRGLATKQLLHEAYAKAQPRKELWILDAGCGLGELSVYLACKGFSVFGLDISTEACAGAQELAEKLEVDSRCTFLATSLENTSLPDSSVDFIIGHAALHHFIKYETVPDEFLRIFKPSGRGFFADSFGENLLYYLFHDKEKMARMGDVPLSANLIRDFFSDFKVGITPTDWFVMLDKLYLRLLPGRFERLIRYISRLHFWLDRRIPSTPRAALFLSGSVMTVITKK